MYLLIHIWKHFQKLGQSKTQTDTIIASYVHDSAWFFRSEFILLYNTYFTYPLTPKQAQNRCLQNFQGDKSVGIVPTREHSRDSFTVWKNIYTHVLPLWRAFTRNLGNEIALKIRFIFLVSKYVFDFPKMAQQWFFSSNWPPNFWWCCEISLSEYGHEKSPLRSLH